MKKWINALLIIALVLCCSLNFAAAEMCADGQHDLEKASKVATCTEGGWESEYCNNCDYSNRIEIPAKGHDLEKASKAATCTEGGWESEFCNNCDYTNRIEIPAKGHDLVKASKAATCTEAGWEAEYCNNCDYENRTEFPAVGHTIVADAAVAPTCTATGLTAGEHCSVCDYKVAQEIVAALGHTIVADAAVAPTCTATGLTAGEHCSVCDYKVAQEIVAAKGHSIVKDAAVSPTCTDTGLTAGEHCIVCDYRVAQRVVAAKGHSIVADAAVEPTCMEDGLTAGEHCIVCDYKVAQEEIPAAGHRYTVTIYQPTTEQKGYEKCACWVCGYFYTYNYTDKLPAPEAAAADMSAFEGIVQDADGAALPYTAAWESDENTEEKILSIVVSADEAGAYGLSQLRLSFELIAQLKEEEADGICFAMGNARLMIPMSIFESEMLAVIEADQADATGYVFTLDPSAANDAGEAGVLVKMEIVNPQEALDVASVSAGLVLMVDDAKADVTESRVYTASDLAEGNL